MYQLGIVIINFRTPQLIVDCLASLLPEILDLNVKVVVVDNYSQDDSCQIISAWLNHNDTLKQVKLISADENTGFSGGNNVGIQDISAEYYLLLNSDTIVREGAIKRLVSAASTDDSAGLISPRLEWPDGTPQESCFRFHTPISELISSAKTSVVTKLFSRFNVPWPITGESTYYDWTSFACVLIKAQVIKDIGLMDDGYFMYYEDVAFSHSAKQAGWKVLNIPEAHIVHLRGGSSSVKSQTKLRKRLPRYYYESRTRYFYKSYGYAGLLAANALWSLGWGISLLRQLVSSSFESSVSEDQWKDIWINFFNPLQRYIHPDNYDKT